MIQLTKGQEQVASMIGGLRAEIIAEPDASDRARELTRRLDTLREATNALVSRDRANMIEDRAQELRNVTLASWGWTWDQHRNTWRKMTAEEHDAKHGQRFVS